MFRRILEAAALFLVAFLLPWPAAGQATAAIEIDTASTTPLQPGFSGISDDLYPVVEYWDYRFNKLAARIGFGWVRFPGGNTSDSYNWQTGQEDPAWVAQLASDGPQQAADQVAGKGGARLIDAANRANFLGASLIVCVNGFTDTADSAGQLASYVQANQIPVVAWELSNEPYLYSGFFPTATAYLDKMKPYRDAIKAVDPNAVVAIFITDSGNSATTDTWNRAVAAYPNKYWDAITFHNYLPILSTTDFAQWMADESAALVNKTDTLVTGQLTPIGPKGVKFLNTEFDPSLPIDSKTGAVSLTKGTLWGGIYAAEYTMRMSTVPSVLYVGASAIWNSAGVDGAANPTNASKVVDAAKQGKTIDTLSLNFDFFIAAQANGVAVLNGVINQAARSNKTTVTGGTKVPATGITGGIPALYAMSYTNTTGGLSVVITNKSATAHQVTVRVNGTAAKGTFPLQFISGSDPSAANTASNPNAVLIETANSGNPVTVPPYSVLRADLQTPTVVTVLNAASHEAVPLAPSQRGIVVGSGLASQCLTADTDPPPPVLGDTTITLTDSAANVWTVPIYSVSPDQATFLMPDQIASGPASVAIARGTETVLTGSFMVSPVSAGVYSANGNAAGVAAATAVATAPDGTTTPLQVYDCRDVPLSCLSTPLDLGDGSSPVTLTLSATGIRYAQSVVVYVAGQPVDLQDYQPQSESGLDQVDVTLPAALAGAGEVSVYLVADGSVSNMTTVKIK